MRKPDPAMHTCIRMSTNCTDVHAQLPQEHTGVTGCHFEIADCSGSDTTLQRLCTISILSLNCRPIYHSTTRKSQGFNKISAQIIRFHCNNSLIGGNQYIFFL